MRHSREYVRASHDCETFARVSHDSPEIFVRASHNSRETFVRVPHDVHAKLNQFYFSELSLEMVLFMSQCADRGKFLAMCLQTSPKDRQWVRDICDDLATVLR